MYITLSQVGNLNCRLQFRYGRHWASTHPDVVHGDLTEFEFEEDEVLTDIAAVAGAVIDAVQITTNLRSFPRTGSPDWSFRTFISSTELIYFSGYENTYAGLLRVSKLAVRSFTCTTY